MERAQDHMATTTTRKRWLKGLLAGATMTGTVLVGHVTPAEAITGAQSLTVVGINDRQTVVATGPVAGVGSVTPIDAESDLLSFANGTLRLDHPQTGGDFHLNPLTCVATATFSGTYTLGQGTGAYAGVSGAGTYSGRGVFRFGHSADGSCSEENELVRFFTARNTGSTSLP